MAMVPVTTCTQANPCRIASLVSDPRSMSSPQRTGGALCRCQDERPAVASGRRSNTLPVSSGKRALKRRA